MNCRRLSVDCSENEKLLVATVMGGHPHFHGLILQVLLQVPKVS